eukprot:PLAT13189.1.p1 GENE.PLAT13189.1~~PLAT13189.1.p1  ORF type:complete len:562 (-),score=288.48 PLAT13189.1:115-1776(-)
MIEGCEVMTDALKSQGVEVVFGIVGIPIVELGTAFMAGGLRYIGMRNEQAASYAAGAAGYMTGRPGVCLVVPGPGVVHALAGLANAQQNCWPMILIGASSDTFLDGCGAFQESPHLQYVRPYVKWAARVDSVERIPFYVEKAVRMSIYGRPGPVYLDIPGNFVQAEVAESRIIALPRCPAPPRCLAEPSAVAAAIKQLAGAERPLIIIGKGAAYSGAEKELLALVEATGIPFLPTPMGKGVISDEHPQCAAAARSLVLRGADVVLLVAARLNWMLHFGKPPRWAKDVKILQLDVSAEEMNNNVAASVMLQGDAKAVTSQLLAAAEESKLAHPEDSPWWAAIRAKVDSNVAKSAELMADDRRPMSYYRALKAVRDAIEPDAIIIGEGANTMDIGRTILGNRYPRHRLDAGTYGTMGIGYGFAIAAAVHFPDKQIVMVQGDSAFGFSAMELEVAARYKLPIKTIILNNNGIYQGLEELPEEAEDIPVTCLTPRAHYEKLAVAFGGTGYYVDSPDELPAVLARALKDAGPTVVNVRIETMGQRKSQDFDWLSRSKL